MADPIVFISTHRVKDGKVTELKEQYEQGTRYIEAEKPGTVVFLAYLNEEETEISTLHVFPDSDAFDAHLEGAAERAKGATEFLEFREFEIFGPASPEALEMMEQAASGEASLTVRPDFVEGYLRLQSSNPVS